VKAEPSSSGGLTNPVGCSVAAAPEPAAFSFGEAAPYAELFTVVEDILETVLTNNAATANLFGLPRGPTSFGEEEVGIDAKAVGGPLPRRHFAIPAEPARIGR
jgi:hypothetical protein